MLPLEDYHDLAALASRAGRVPPPQAWVQELIDEASGQSHEAAGPG